MAPWYKMADAAVPSSRSEGLPFNVMEAMYMGLPVVASAVKGHVDLITENETGLLYPYANAGACTKQIERLMNDPGLRTRLSENARERVQQYSLAAALPQVMRYYDSMTPADVETPVG